MAISITQHKSGHSIASATSVDISVAATAANALIVVGCASAGTRTVSGVADDKGNTYVQASGAAAHANSSADATDIWYCLKTTTSGVTTVTITYSGSAGTFVKDGEVWEVAGFTNADIDVAKALNDFSQTTNVTTGPTVTTTATAGFIAAEIKVPAGSIIDLNPNTGNEFTSGGDIASGTDSAGCSLISSSSGNHTPAWHDGNSFINTCASAAAFKESTTVKPSGPFPTFRPDLP